MYFIGSGGLLYHAVNYSLANGLKVDGVCCPPDDPIILKLRRRNVSILESFNPNKECLSVIKKCSDDIVFSINNKYIIGDYLLSSGSRFFNIHNGLVQEYRGLGEVCIFAAICNGDNHYGVTLHQLLPYQRVDTGPVLCQLKFEILTEELFSDVLSKSIEACRKIFELNVQNIISNSYTILPVDKAKDSLSYKNIAFLYQNASLENRQRASDLGHYSVYLPKLKNIIEKCADPINLSSELYSTVIKE